MIQKSCESGGMFRVISLATSVFRDVAYCRKQILEKLFMHHPKTKRKSIVEYVLSGF